MARSRTTDAMRAPRNLARLKKYADKAFNRVLHSPGKKRCGTSPRGAKPRVCVAVEPQPNMACGYNKINNLYACVAVKGGKRKRRR